MADAPTSTGAAEPRRILDRYRLEERLGVGGTAEVWRAEDELLGRMVAVKLLHTHLLPDASSRARVEAEARSAAALTHPGIVGVYDIAMSDDEAAIVLEYVAGEPLNDLLARQGRLAERVAAAIGRQVAEALEHAHERGIVHRDVKPANILVSPDGRARLVDFGIARTLEENAERLTLTGAVVGTLRYMAPEQLDGEPADRQTDVFGLGATLYEMLAGRPPFEASGVAVLL
ncbi:MAG: serine/threonine protein kinase, partial [Chloroflexi bacterium]|nr:serine/threonine protein kinase [Chloroflexota bacterium]